MKHIRIDQNSLSEDYPQASLLHRVIPLSQQNPTIVEGFGRTQLLANA